MTQSLAIAGWITSILLAIGAIGTALRIVWRILSKLSRVADAFLGEPPGPGAPNGRPGILERQESTERALTEVMEAMRSMSERLQFVESQFKPNGGESLRDTVNKIADLAAPPGNP